MNYNEALAFLVEELPMFQQKGAAAYNPGVDRTLAFSEAAGNPHLRFASVHVGGTNGKGSTSTMIASVLRESGYRVGLYTSPHLIDFRERIQIDGEMISQEAVTDFVTRHHEYIKSNALSFFEATTIMAFDYFAREGVDIAVVEVGLGGKYDSTNIITPLLSVITNIDLDHTAILGNTIGEIAIQKGGIIKSEIPVVVGESHPLSDIALIEQAKKEGTQIIFADKCYNVESRGDGLYHLRSYLNQEEFDLRLSLEGNYQSKNLATALVALECLASRCEKITRSSVEEGLSRARISGRWQIIGQNPLVVCDTAHNVAGIRDIASQLQSVKYDKLYIVLAMVSDKDIRGVLELLPKDAYYYFTQARLPRAMSAWRLADLASDYSLLGEVVALESGGVSESLRRARSYSSAGDLIFVGGSTFTVAEVLQ